MNNFLRKLLVAASLILALSAAHATDYGRTTQGASFREVESDINGTTVVVTGGETSISVFAYLQTTSGSTADCRAAFYNPVGDTIAYQTNQITFSDDVGGWKEMPFTTAVSAGTYLLSIACGGIAGGAATINIATDTVTATSTLRRASNATGGSQSTYPTLPSPVTWDGATGTDNISIYFHTSAGAASTVLNPISGKGGAAAQPITQ